MTDFPYVYCWANNPERAKYKHKRCRVVTRAIKMNTVLLEFEDGHRMASSGSSIRRAKR